MSSSSDSATYAKRCEKNLYQQIDVVAEFHAHRISAPRIAYRTGIAESFVEQLIGGALHQPLFKHRLAHHRKARRDQRLNQSRRIKGIAQADLQDQIESEYQQSLEGL